VRGHGVGGRVASNSTPLTSAAVYAYQLASLSLYKVITDPQGNFLFRDLPAGLYKIIAHKPGFEPVVVLLTRNTPSAYQFLDLQLAQDTRPAAAANPPNGAARATGANGIPVKAANQTDGDDADFWALRGRIPTDVLRDIEASEMPVPVAVEAKAAQPGQTGGSLPLGGTLNAGNASSLSPGARFRTEVQAMTGVANVAQVGVGQVASGKLGIEGQLGGVQVGLSGRFLQMTSDGLAATSAHGLSPAGDSKTSAMSLDLQAGPSSKITVTSLNNHLVPTTGGLAGSSIGLDHYQVAWTQALSENSHSDFVAGYTSENNYHHQSAVDPADIPDASRTWDVEGAYTRGFGDSATLQAGFRYSEELVGAFNPLAASPNSVVSTSMASAAVNPLTAGSLSNGGNLANGLTGVGAAGSILPDHQAIDFFTRGGTRLHPAVVVEYGMYSTLNDGTLSLTPQGGVVLQLGDGWQARGSASHRVYQEADVNPAFLPALFKESDLCEQDGKACYELNLSRHSGDDDSVSFSAIERIVGQTLRLYFSDIAFDRLESVYLVAGDSLPELRLVVKHRLTPNVRTSFESSVASGGGGVFTAADGRPYKNQVKYMVTSLDTRFVNTSTGVFVAFHHLTQNLAPMTPIGSQSTAIAGAANAVEFDRLQVSLSQDLNCLWNIAAQWALQVNMELSRGLDPSYYASTDTNLHRSILGGIAVKF
jgi:hypothetical protein